MSKIAIYGHGGCQNHGNEAIVRALTDIFKDNELNLYTFSLEKEEFLDDLETLNIFPIGKNFSKLSLIRILNAFNYRVMKRENLAIYKKIRFKNLLTHNNDIYLLEAGDQYIENSLVRDYYAYINKKLKEKGKITVAYGCSIDPKLLKHKELIDDLNNYSFIFPRESITYMALKDANIQANIQLISDPAFALKPKKCPLPEQFLKNKTIGLNIGPLSQGLGKYYNLLIENYEVLIRFILNETDFNIALIPHVNWGPVFSDIVTMEMISKKFSDQSRIFIIPEQGAPQQKYVLSQCKIVVTLRTHASIASYSSCVPTLVTGYKTKTTGIAKDLFGSFENYIVPVPSLNNQNQIKNAFIWFLENETMIRTKLNNIMPGYIQKAYLPRNVIQTV
jgi:polysaccharide pyruvyl transferase WcaK-like protein